MNANLRLHLLKQMLNFPMRILDRFLPERTAYVSSNSDYGSRCLSGCSRRINLEVSQGVFKEIGKFEGDGNFLRMLNVSRKLLLAIGEDDRYYREWIGLLDFVGFRGVC